jgi:hypothetical protein
MRWLGISILGGNEVETGGPAFEYYVEIRGSWWKRGGNAFQCKVDIGGSRWKRGGPAFRY